jgi:hypothetical protein
MRYIVALLLLLSSFALAVGGHSGSHHSSRPHSSKSHPVKPKKDKGNKTVHVSGYYRKDGTYVTPYDRSAPGTATSSASGIGATDVAGRSYRKGHVAEGYVVHPSVAIDKRGKIKRSTAAKAAFERQSPCPSTGRTNGRCPGYVVDHVMPLECGGADNPSNMQWQTTSDSKVKDKTERACRL